MFKITIYLMSLCIIASCATDDPVSREEILSEGQKPINIFHGELENIYFAPGQVTLTEQAKQIIDSNIQVLKQNPKFTVTVEGHTDQSGSKAHNIEIGRKRAMAVYRYMVQAGIPATRIKMRSMGESSPIVTVDEQASYRMNRRVELDINPYDQSRPYNPDFFSE